MGDFLCEGCGTAFPYVAVGVVNLLDFVFDGLEICGIVFVDVERVADENEALLFICLNFLS